MPFVLSESGFDPDIIGLPGGGYVTAWIVGSTDNDQLFLRIYSPSGEPDGDVILVSLTSGFVDDPKIAVLNDGNICITWTHEFVNGFDPEWGYPTYDSEVRAEILSPTGETVVPEYVIRTGVGEFDSVGVAALSGGSFALVTEQWDAGNPEIEGDETQGIHVQVFGANGSATSADVFVNGAIEPMVASLANGGFVILYQNAAYDPATEIYYYPLYAQTFDAAGAATGLPVLVGTTDDDYCDIAGLSGGGFVVTWPDLSGDVRARLFNDTGVPLNDSFIVSTVTAGWQGSPSVSAIDGRFLITWDHEFEDGSDALRGQWFTESGTREGDNFQIAAQDGGFDATLAAVSGGGYALVWEFENSTGGESAFAHFVPGGLNIDPLQVEADGQDFELATDGESAAGEGTITIGRSDGTFPLLTAADGTGEYDATNLVVHSGSFTPSVNGVSQSLWAGSLTVDVATQVGTIVDTDADGTYLLAGQEIDFRTVSILPDSLEFGVSFDLPDDLSGLTVDVLSDAGAGLVFDADGVHLSELNFSTGINADFDLFGVIPARISSFSIEYQGTTDSLLFRSKITLGEIVDGEGDIVADFSEEKYIRYGPDGLAAAIAFDVNSDFQIAGWGLEQLHIELNTDAHTAGGSATIQTPFGATLADDGADITIGLKINYSPFEIDSVSIAASELDIPLPTMPLFRLTDMEGSVNNLAPSNPKAVEFKGSIEGTYGPDYFGSKLATLKLTGTISENEMTGAAEVIFAKVDLNAFGGLFEGDFSVLSATANAALNWTNGTLSGTATLNILEGLFTTSSNLYIDANWNMLLSGQFQGSLPKWVPLYSGASLANGNVTVQFLNDGITSNDFVLVAGQVRIQESFFGVPVTLVLDAGLRIGFDGSVDRAGVKELSAVGTSGAESGKHDALDQEASSAPAMIVEAGEEYILLSAHWTNASGNAELVITLPDGTVIHEAEFEQHRIAIVEEFSNDQSRVAIAFNPEAGNWSVTAQSSTGALEGLQTSILVAASAPTLAIDVISAISESELSINFTAVDEDSDAQITFWYSTNPDPSNGTLIGSAAETDAAGSITWDTEGLAAGRYYIFAVIDDGSSAPVTVQGGSMVVVAEGQPPEVRPIGVDNDFNGDGISDILWRSDSGQLSNWLGNDAGGFANNDGNAFTHVSTDWWIVGTGDFNGDGHSDVLWWNEDSQLSNWLGQADGGFVNNDTNAFTTVADGWQVVGTGDFNGDHYDDILWRGSNGELSNWLGQANGGFANNDVNAFASAPLDWQVAGTGDFNGDGRDDVLWRSQSGQLSNWLGTESAGFVNNDANAFTSAPTNWIVVGTGDFNGDGFDDLLWRSTTGELSNWLGTESGGFVNNDANAFTAVPTNWHVVSVGDYNGDGFDDILWRDHLGQLSNWLGTESGGFVNNDANAFNSAPTNWHTQPEAPLV